MITDEAAVKYKEFDAIYRLHADTIYKYCLYYSRDEEKAKDITYQAFLNFYNYYKTVDSDIVLKCLFYEVKKLLSNSQHQELQERS